MVKIVVAGMIDKDQVEKLVQKYGDGKVETVVMSDLDGAMAVKNGQAQYYVGACNTGGGGALAMAIAMLGSDKCASLSMPSIIKSKEEVQEEVANGKLAFGFTIQHAEQVLANLIPELIK